MVSNLAFFELFIFHDPCLVAFPVPILGNLAFVMELFTLGKRNFDFDDVVFPVHGKGYDGIALTFHATD